MKLRTKCWKCGTVGHWGRECTQGEKRNAVGSSATTSSKSGFFVSSHPEPGGENSTFWLRQFVAKNGNRPSRSCEDTAVRMTEDAYKGAGEEAFCGIATRSHEGLVDTAAEGGLIGSDALDRLVGALRHRGLQVVWTPKQASAKGVGSRAEVIGVVWIPIGIASVNGILECTVVRGEVPLLLPVQLLRVLKVVLDFCTGMFIIKEHGTHIPMHSLHSGHVTIDVLQFHRDGFSDPDEAPGMRTSSSDRECDVGSARRRRRPSESGSPDRR